MRESIPNILTASNLFCGTLALIMVWQDHLWACVALIAAALLLDFFDGFVARLLGVSSPVGKELDSLADVVSFGVVPGFVMARLIRTSQGAAFPDETLWEAGIGWLWMLGLLIAVFSAVRLARFNLDTRQSDVFIGLPTPANAIFVIGLWILVEQRAEWALVQGINQPAVWALISLVSCYLLLANVRLLALKFHDYGLKGNVFRYGLLVGAAILLATLGGAGFSFIILFYLALSLIDNLLRDGHLAGRVASD